MYSSGSVPAPEPEVAQPPDSGNEISELKTVVATGTKWKLAAPFNVSGVSTSNKKCIRVSKKKNKSKSRKKAKWYDAEIKARKPGVSEIVLEGTGGEKIVYLIYAESPKIIKNSLKFNDIRTVSMNDYITGVTYLRPTSVISKKTKVATVSGDFSISAIGNGSSRITLSYGKKKIRTTLSAKLPAFTRAKVSLKKKPVRLKLKNLPKNASITYKSSDVKAVRMNREGFAAPVSNGTAKVTATVGNVTAECTVTVKGLK
ncbi:MAG: hypothetical protein K5985_01895 [Lachnospiraceae bacterium]|nr:hypothetical protein [Lachnospiraceae bacterium]